MVCPACQHPVDETTAACGQCGFSLPALDRLLGIPPTLHYPITDFRREFSARESRQIQRRVRVIEHRFPGVRCAVITCGTPEKISLSLYTFWLFNRGALTSAVERGGHNRLILLVLDSTEQRASCMLGYGLEPLVGQSLLNHSLQAMKPALRRDQPAAAVLEFLTEMERLLDLVSRQLGQTYGIHAHEFSGLRELLQPEAESTSWAY